MPGARPEAEAAPPLLCPPTPQEAALDALLAGDASSDDGSQSVRSASGRSTGGDGSPRGGRSSGVSGAQWGLPVLRPRLGRWLEEGGWTAVALGWWHALIAGIHNSLAQRRSTLSTLSSTFCPCAHSPPADEEYKIGSDEEQEQRAEEEQVGVGGPRHMPSSVATLCTIRLL